MIVRAWIAAFALAWLFSWPAFADNYDGPGYTVPYPATGNGATGSASDTARAGQVADLVHDFGAVGDGVADDTVPVQNWLSALAATGQEASCKGKFRITSSVSGFSPTNRYHMHGAGIGICNFYIDFNGWGLVGIDLTNPNAPTTSNRGVLAEWDHFSITYNPALVAPPIAFRDRYATDLRLHDAYMSQYTVHRGTILSLSAAFNLEHIHDLDIWAGGANVTAHLVPTGTTFSITASATALTSGVSFFSSADVGLAYRCRPSAGGNYDEVFIVSAFVSSTQVTVSRTASQTHTGVLCAASGVTGSISANSNSLTVNVANVPATYIGQTVYVEGAGSVLGTAIGVLRSTITGVSGSTITLADNATTASSNAVIIFSPPVELYQEGATGPNDVILDNVHEEDFAGTGLVINGCSYCRLPNQKLAALNNASNYGQTELESQFNAAYLSSDVSIGNADIEGSSINPYGQQLVEGNTRGTYFGNITGIITTGLAAIAMRNNENGSVAVVATINSDAQYDGNWLSATSAYYNDGTSANGVVLSGGVSGYNSSPLFPTGRFGQLIPTTIFQGVTSAINSGDTYANARFNSFQGMSIKNSNSAGQNWFNMGNDSFNQAFQICLAGSADAVCAGAGTAEIINRVPMTIGGSTSTQGIAFDTSGNANALSNFGVSHLSGTGSRPVCVTSTGQLEAGTLSAGLVTCP